MRKNFLSKKKKFPAKTEKKNSDKYFQKLLKPSLTSTYSISIITNNLIFAKKKFTKKNLQITKNKKKYYFQNY